MYDVPESGPAKLEYRGLPLDEIEDLLPRSSAHRQAARILLPQPAAIKGRRLTPLHGGQVALCAVSGAALAHLEPNESKRFAPATDMGAALGLRYRIGAISINRATDR